MIMTLIIIFLQILLTSFIFWCVDEKKGPRLAFIFPVSAWINLALTSLLDRQPAFSAASGPAAGKPGMFIMPDLPVMLMIIALWALFPLLVYFIASKFSLAKRIESWFDKRGPRAGLLAAALLAFAMNMYRPSEYMLIPGGLILGLGIGRFLCGRYMDFTAAINDRTGTAKLLTLLVRYILGITAMALLYVATGKAVNALRGQGNYQLYVFTRYVLITVWLSAGAPWVFCKLRLV